MIKKISIISLGWLGQALYQRLMQSPHEVNGSYLNEPKNDFKSFQYDFNEKKIPTEIQDSDILFINLPPSKIESLDQFKWFLKENTQKRILFISSTSVYGDQGEVTEIDELKPTSSNGKYLKDLEQALSEIHQDYCIIRPGGLYGQERHPGKYLAGKDNLTGGKDWLNLTGQDDLIEIIMKVITSSKNNIINAVNIHHPPKKEFYTNYAIKNNLEAPLYINENKQSKKVNTQYSEYEIKTPLF